MNPPLNQMNNAGGVLVTVPQSIAVGCPSVKVTSKGASRSSAKTITSKTVRERKKRKNHASNTVCEGEREGIMHQLCLCAVITSGLSPKVLVYKQTGQGM